MITITPALLQAAMGCSADRAELFAPHLHAACQHYGVDTPDRLAALLAQLGHESGALRWVREVADGSAYEGRADLGNVRPGDGTRYRGRGLIQITGRHNYAETAQRMQPLGAPDFERDPEALEQPQWAAWSAVDWWDSRNLNALADRGDFDRITRVINGGINGAADRRARWERARFALQQLADPATAPVPAPAQPPAPASMPPGDAPDWTPPPTPQETAMPIPAVIAALLPSLIQTAPQLIRIFGSGGAVSERNAKAAEAVAEIARTVTAQPTTEGAVQALQSDPALAAQYREEVHLSMGELLGHLQQAVEIDDKSRAAAMDRTLQLAQATGGRWLWVLAAAAGLILISALAITAAVLFSTSSFSDETKALVLGQIVILGFGTVVQWLFGSNIANRVQQQQASGAVDNKRA